MKKYILILSIFLGTTIAYSQDFKQWAFDVEWGIHSVNDESAVDANNWYHLGAGLRYNFNPTFGLGARVGYDDIELISLEGLDAKTNILRLNSDVSVNLFRVLDLYSPWFTMLAHGGPGVAFIESDDHKETVLNNQIGLTGLFKVTNSVALKLDYTIASNISQKRTLDGIYDNNNFGVTSTVHSASVGAVFYIGSQNCKVKHVEEHADWYVAPPVKTTIEVRPEQKIIKETKIIREEAVCDCDADAQSEYVFFDHDEAVIKDTELNAIYKAFAQLEEHPTYTLVIKGFASPTNSSAYYNQVLSEKRSEALRKKYELMGLDMSRVTIDSYGKDLDKADGYVHDAARRVELIVVKN
jgi:outer membrane protein OmpA-like peptidoglycan-associated protein